MVSGTAVWIAHGGHHVTVGWLRRNHACDRRAAKFVTPNGRWYFGPRTAGLPARGSAGRGRWQRAGDRQSPWPGRHRDRMRGSSQYESARNAMWYFIVPTMPMEMPASRGAD